METKTQKNNSAKNGAAPYAVISVGEFKRRTYGRIVKTFIASVLALSCVGGMFVSSTDGGRIFSGTMLTASAEGSAVMNSVENVEKKLIEKGLNFIADKIPYVGDKLKDFVSPFILDALGLHEETEPKMTIDDLSKQLSEMSANMNSMENDLKDYMDSNTWQLIQAINNDNILTQYKNGMNKLSIGGNSSLSELSELENCNEDGTPKYNKSQKLFIIADSIGSTSTWNTEGSIPFNLRLVGGYLAGANYLSEKDMFTAICDSRVVQNNCVFYDEAQEAVEPYIAYLMKDYLAIYSITLEAVKAQDMIETALENHDTSVFDPEELGSSYAKRFGNYISTRSQRDSLIGDLKKLLYGNGNDDAKCIFNRYYKFCEHDRREYIDGGKESTELTFEHRLVEGKADVFTNIYNTNYLTGAALQNLINHAKSDGVSVADYLKAHNNPLPEGSQWLLVSEGVKENTERVKTYRVDYTDRIYDEITVIDVNDATLKMQKLCPYEYLHARQYGIGHTDFYSDYKYTPVDVVVIKNSVADNGALFGNLGNDGEYHVKSGVYKLKRDFYANGTIAIDEGADVTIDLAGNRINRNLDAINNNGSVFAVKNGAKLRVIDSTGTGALLGGYARSGGGAVYVCEGGEAVLEGISVDGNKAGEKGGAFFVKGKLTLTGCRVTGNESPDGGAVYCDTNGNVTINGDTHFSSNKTTVYGGGALVNYGTMDIDGISIDNNTAVTRGGAIWTSGNMVIKNAMIQKNQAGIDGGGIYVKTGGSFRIENSTISENTADYGGGIYSQRTRVSADNVVISENTANKHGGGVFTQNAGDGGTITFTNSTIINNTSEENGGGIYSNNCDCYQKCTISGNKAKGDGGALFVTYACYQTVLSDSKLVDNTAGNTGGAIRNDGNVRFINCELTGNHADCRGGGYCCELGGKAVGYMEGGSMNGNTAPTGANDYDPLHHFWVTNGGNVNGKAFY